MSGFPLLARPRDPASKEVTLGAKLAIDRALNKSFTRRQGTARGFSVGLHPHPPIACAVREQFEWMNPPETPPTSYSKQVARHRLKTIHTPFCFTQKNLPQSSFILSLLHCFPPPTTVPKFNQTSTITTMTSSLDQLKATGTVRVDPAIATTDFPQLTSSTDRRLRLGGFQKQASHPFYYSAS